MSLSADLILSWADFESETAYVVTFGAAVVAWFLSFGMLSRRFELEADLVSLQLVGDSEPVDEPAGSSPGSGVRFTDVAAKIGLSFEYDTGRSPYRWLMETLGGGVAVMDYDRDGWDDLYLSQGGPLPVRRGATSSAVSNPDFSCSFSSTPSRTCRSHEASNVLMRSTRCTIGTTHIP